MEALRGSRERYKTAREGAECSYYKLRKLRGVKLGEGHRVQSGPNGS